MIDLSAFATPHLDLNLGRGRKVSIPPPSAEDGAKLGALVTIGTAVGTNEVDENILKMYEELSKDMTTDDLERLALGSAYDQMIRDGWHSADIKLAGQYATYYWVFGERVADEILKSQHGDGGSGKAPKRGKN